MAYEKQEWVGSVDPLIADPDSTPLSDDRLNHLETQYDEAVDYIVTRMGGLSLVKITQEAYDALPTPRPDDVLYIITS